MGGNIHEISRRSFLSGGSISANLLYSKANLLRGKRFCISNETNKNLQQKYIDAKTKETFYTAVSVFYECLVKKEEIGEKKFVQAYKTVQGILLQFNDPDHHMTTMFEEMESDLAEMKMFDECFEA
jgi:hypothetical protein